MKKFLFFTLTIACIGYYASAQNNNLGIGTGTPDSSAMLEILSSNKGLLVPRMTATERLAIPSPANALLVYDTDSACFLYYKQPTSEWINLCSEFAESDPVFVTSVAAGITGTDTSNWNNKLDTETDPVFGSSTAAGITAVNTGNWNSAYNWGDHAAAGYLTTENDADPSNELQDLSSTVSGTDRTIQISGGVGTTISVADNDNDSANELQDLSSAVSGTDRTINISGGTGTTISVADNDNDPTNELQTIVSSDADNDIAPGTDGGAFMSVAGDLDTTRTLLSDLLLTSTLCNCTSLPPAMIQSLLSQGYTATNLVDFNVATADLVAAGVSVSDLLASGVTPKQIFDNGIPLDSLYGKTYQGGLIAYLDTITGTGLIAAPTDQSTGIQWWNGSYIVTGATGTGIGTGQSNTDSIIAAQGAGSYAATLCDGLTIGIYSDWFLPSKDELNLLYLNLHVNGLGAFTNNGYWSSTEFDVNFAWIQNCVIGSQTVKIKPDTYYVRAVRAF